ncbi:hypothetical protein J437_LFUL015773 [Ladona fulva]|uniref:Uncharacterized protein n=1 Tax=Ladona fulva TaxID=123851 RepID=A0A8K0P5E7_LADFU|nr:hypothetical protein J437_LFUL015773 [Ladona fulva]
MDKCVEIVNRYVENDPDVKQAYDFLRSDSFESLLTNLEQLPEYKEFVQYLYDSGFDYYKYLNIIRSILNLPPRPRPTRIVKEDPGLIKMIKEILGTFPIDEMRSWYVTVCVPDPDFQALLARIRSPEFIKLVEYVYSSQQYKDMKQMLLDQGIDVDKIEEAIADFLNNARVGPNNINRRMSPRNLNTLLDEFLSFIPTAKILEIFLDYVHKNDDIKNIIAYLKGDEFKALVVKIEALQEFKNFLVVLYGYGLDIYRALNLVLDLLGLPNVTPVLVHRFPSTQSGLTEMVDKMLALLPLDEIAKWYFTTCEPNLEFQDVLARMRRDEFKVIVTAVKEDPAFTTIRQGLINLDVDVTAI